MNYRLAVWAYSALYSCSWSEFVIDVGLAYCKTADSVYALSYKLITTIWPALQEECEDDKC